MRPASLSHRLPRSTLAVVLLGLLLASTAGPVAAGAPSVTSSTDAPITITLADCGSYRIRETYVIRWRIIAYDNGTSRAQSSVDGRLFRTDQPEITIGRDRLHGVQYFGKDSVSRVTGNVIHIVLRGHGTVVHDVGQFLFTTDGGFVLVKQTGKHPVLTGGFDWSSLCDL